MSRPVVTIGNVFTIIRNVNPDMILDLHDYLSFEVPGARFAVQNYPNWDGRKHLFDKKNLRFLTGLTHRVCKRLKEKFGVMPEIIWDIKPPEKNLNLEWSDQYKIRDYQRELIDTLLEKKRGLLTCATGGGKTVVVAKLIQELNVSPFIFYVLTRDLMYQSRDRLQEAIPNANIGIIGDGTCEIKDINIMTIQTATSAFVMDQKQREKELKEISQFAEMDDIESKEFKKEVLTHVEENRQDIINLIKTAKGIYADEAHHMSAETCRKIMIQSPDAFYRFGGSATPERTDNSYLVIEGLFGRQTAVVTASDLIRRGYLMQPDITFIKLNTEMQVAHNFAKDREIHIIKNDERNEAIVKLAKKLADQDLSILILVQIVEHGKMLEKMIPGSVFIYGLSDKKKRSEYIKKLRDGDHKILISSRILDEGADLPGISGLILGGGGKSPIQVKQRVGRVIRKGSKHAYVFDFLDVGKWTSKHSRARMKILQAEPEFKVKTVKIEKILKEEFKDLF